MLLLYLANFPSLVCNCLSSTQSEKAVMTDPCPEATLINKHVCLLPVSSGQCCLVNYEGSKK